MDETEQQKNDLDYIKEAASFTKRACKFDTVLILATKMSGDGDSERFQFVDGNLFTAVGLASYYLDDKFKQNTQE